MSAGASVGPVDRFPPGARWVTFDCFGTLVDWHSGFDAVLRPLFGERTSEVLRAYHVCEREAERERPHRNYKEVLGMAVSRAAASVGVSCGTEAATALPKAWGSLPVFEDVEAMLAELRRSGFRLGVLTNCDNDLFAETARGFRQPFDLVVTAERVRHYKPDLAHFRSFAAESGVAPGAWVHVACSWYHDIVPAKAMGVPSVWLDREGTGEFAGANTRQVRVASEVNRAAQHFFEDRLARGS